MRILLVVLLVGLLVSCDEQSSFLIVQGGSGSSSSSEQEYSNLYIAGDPGEISVLNISGVPTEVYEVHIE